MEAYIVHTHRAGGWGCIHTMYTAPKLSQNMGAFYFAQFCWQSLWHFERYNCRQQAVAFFHGDFNFKRFAISQKSTGVNSIIFQWKDKRKWTPYTSQIFLLVLVESFLCWYVRYFCGKRKVIGHCTLHIIKRRKKLKYCFLG